MTSRSEALSLGPDFWPWSRSLFTAHGSRQGIFAVSGRHSEWFISKRSGAAVRLACASTCDEWGESIQHFIQLAPVVGHALHQVWELRHRDLATPAHKLRLLSKIIGWSKMRYFEGWFLRLEVSSATTNVSIKPFYIFMGNISVYELRQKALTVNGGDERQAGWWYLMRAPRCTNTEARASN